MAELDPTLSPAAHSHVFLGEGHEHAERRTWIVIGICGAMMALEIVGGGLFGSIALIADGLHMSTHAGALLLAALAYSYARRHAGDERFSFGTGKLGDLAGFTSAIILAMIAVLIGYEAVSRLLAPVAIHFAEAIPIACLGLVVNIVSAWVLSSGGHHHHGHGHDHGHAGAEHGEEHRIVTPRGALYLGVFEMSHPPVFRIRAEDSTPLAATSVSVETVRPDGARQTFAMQDRGGFLQSTVAIPEPHAFTAHVRVNGADYAVRFEEHDHGHGAAAHRDNNMRSAIVHVMADAAVSVMVIVGLLLARAFGWLWMDPLAGIAGACVIASWSYGLIRDTGAILLDMNPDDRVTADVRRTVEQDGDRLTDLHVWRLGPGHLGAIVCLETASVHGPEFYRERLRAIPALSHVTVEVQRAA
ncbi:MAG TPA: CDF family Co(II)/Ni(II) efflux transporter DmeF [Caulobacteraceae bacterium]|jgi:cation diffusion facilitator family transporter|nr:CDF family Co(II)/Ni(II) efflux transporter DmeF [Caulobacteraceae bacterium]